MTMLIPAFPFDFPSFTATGFGATVVPAGCVPFTATVPCFTRAAAIAGLAPCGMRDTLGEDVMPVTPMERACVDAASWEDFSRISFCFSSSLARIETRSSGIGLFSLKVWLNLSNSALRLSISLLTRACFFWVKRWRSFVTKSRNAGTGSA